MEFQIKFRAFEKGDHIFINNLRTGTHREKLIGGSKRYVSVDRDEKWVNDIIFGDRQDTLYFAITELNSNDIIGYTSISDIDYRNGSCFWSGIKLSPKVSGKGYGVQTALLILKFVFEELRMVRCIGQCQENHDAALKMMLKVGFSKEGLMRKYVFKNGESINTWLLSIIDTDYKAVKEQFKI